MASGVNLDALIPREDFEVEKEDNPSQQISTFSIRDLEQDAFLYSQLRKPDFQRETNEWDSERVTGLLRSFVNGDLIPAIILWNSGSYVFVIDGAHRIAALLAWVNDDYGDGRISKLFFDGIIPDDQLRIAETTRRAVNRLIGPYADHKLAPVHPDKVKTAILDQSKRLATVALQTQWVKGDAAKAESSFFKINQQAAPIDNTEIRLLQARTKPNTIAARAIIRSGTGHKYWSRFDSEKQNQIEEIAREINSALFTPLLKSPIKTLDLPAAGKGFSAKSLPLVFDFVNLANDVKSDTGIPDDIIGENTLQYLAKCQKIVNRICGTHPSSLGLHPAVYFYSDKGRYQPTAFLAVVSMLKEFERHDSYLAFTRVRERFENFLLGNKHLVKAIVYKHGSGLKGYSQLKDLFLLVIEHLRNEQTDKEILESLGKHKEYARFLLDKSEPEGLSGHEFSQETKSATYLREAMKNPLRCSLCGGLLHQASISVDHVIRRRDEGPSSVENAQLTHPYCNSTYKQ